MVAQLVEEDAYGFKAGDLYFMEESAFVSEADLEEVFGDGYPPDPTIQISEPQTSEPSGNVPRIRALAVGALVVLAVVLIKIRSAGHGRNR